MKNHSDMLCRNQFILGPSFPDTLKSWIQTSLNRSIYITSHPDLHVYQAKDGNKSITLLGYILDADNPELSSAHIVDSLVLKLSQCDNFYENTCAFGGRWILIVNDGRRVRLFHDAGGLRQVFYTDTRYTKELWCASQPELIAGALKLHMDGDAVDFICRYRCENDEYWWPGDRTPYREMRHLLPNHSLDLETGLCKRYWPDREIGRRSLDEAVEKISATLQGMMESASHRFDLTLSLTAGWDSRLVLAASRRISDRVSYMTVKSVSMPEDHADIQVPALLLSKLGLRHEVVRSPDTMDAAFEERYKKSVAFAHDVWAPDAQAIFCHYRHTKVAVTGSGSETAIKFRYPPTMARSEFAAKSLREWFSTLGTIYDIELDNIFYWEQRVGNWLAMCQLEFDSAWKDIFTPFNCRDLLVTILSVDGTHRRRPKHTLYKTLIQNLWPEVLSVPVNPHQTPGTLARIKTLVKRELSGLRLSLGRKARCRKTVTGTRVDRFLSPCELGAFRKDHPKKAVECRG